jgi:hypothetical protein
MKENAKGVSPSIFQHIPRSGVSLQSMCNPLLKYKIKIRFISRDHLNYIMLCFLSSQQLSAPLTPLVSDLVGVVQQIAPVCRCLLSVLW